jgi:ferritin-like metal-binding protein YciE
MNTAEEQGEAGIIDVALIAVLRRIEFCEISSYETARSIAEALGEEEVLKILEENLREEEVMERFLTVLSEELIDDQSLSGGASREPSYSVAGAHNGTSREGRGGALTQAT